MTWTLAQARDQFSEVVRRAVDHGPQTISVRGKDTVVVVSKTEFETRNPLPTEMDLKELLLSIPSLDGIDLTRDARPARDFEF